MLGSSLTTRRPKGFVFLKVKFPKRASSSAVVRSWTYPGANLGTGSDLRCETHIETTTPKPSDVTAISTGRAYAQPKPKTLAFASRTAGPLIERNSVALKFQGFTAKTLTKDFLICFIQVSWVNGSQGVCVQLQVSYECISARDVPQNRHGW